MLSKLHSTRDICPAAGGSGQSRRYFVHHQIAKTNVNISEFISYKITFLIYFRLQRFEKTNEMLTNCNALSQNRLKNVTEDYKKNCKLLLEMKRDLEYIFKKIRTIKGKLETKYPDAFEQVNKQVPTHIEEDEDASGVIDYEQLESTKQIDPALEARDSSDSTS